MTLTVQPQPLAVQQPLAVTIHDAARMLSYNERTIRRLIERGELAAVGRGRLRRVPVSSLLDYLSTHWQGPDGVEPLSILAANANLPAAPS